MSLGALSLTEAAEHIRDGRIKSVELVRDCLARIDQVDADVQAWAFLDRDHAMRQAEAADLHRMTGAPLGPLHGVPIGIKDIFDTGDMPTEFGSPVWAGRTPRADAYAVARWLCEADELGILTNYFTPPLTERVRAVANLEGWILGVY